MTLNPKAADNINPKHSKGQSIKAMFQNFLKQTQDSNASSKIKLLPTKS